MNLKDVRVLVVDDEKELRSMIKDVFQNAGYGKIDIAGDGRQAEELFEQNTYHFVILDVMLPDCDGFSVLQRWREKKNNTPVIFLSAKDEDKDRLQGLNLGADDYITKPFLQEELLLRAKVILRRTYHLAEENQIYIGDAKVDFDAGTVENGSEIFALTAKEWVLLQKLYENRGKIVSINSLMDTLWPDGSFGYENSLMVHMRRLREKVEENPSKPQYLITVRGLGYKLKD